MPRGKRTVFGMFCKECNTRIGSIRLHKQKDGASWKDFKTQKYCKVCRKRVDTKMKEERHSK